MKLEPGWLMRTCHEAHIAVMCDHNPGALKHLWISPRATESDAAELYAKMATRFEAWTGKTLAGFTTPLGG